jgi:hypothetical protein
MCDNGDCGNYRASLHPANFGHHLEKQDALRFPLAKIIAGNCPNIAYIE